MTIIDVANLINYNDDIHVENNRARKIHNEEVACGKDLSKLKIFYCSSRTNLKWTIICFCLFFFIFPLIIGYIIQLVWAIKCLLLNVDELKEHSLIWGIIGLILPILPIFIMRKITLNTIDKYDSNFRWVRYVNR